MKPVHARLSIFKIIVRIKSGIILYELRWWPLSYSSIRVLNKNPQISKNVDIGELLSLRIILWPDESNYDSIAKYHNVNFWARIGNRYPHKTRKFPLNILIGIIDDNSTGPQFLPNKWNIWKIFKSARRRLNMLKKVFLFTNFFLFNMKKKFFF